MFKDLKGNRPALELLERYARSRRTGYTLLLTGPAGIGKRLAALEFVRSWCCEGAKEACGDCAGCRDFDRAQHPDVVRLACTDKTVVAVEDTRAALEEFYRKPIRSPARILLIEDAEAVSDESMNTLLKALEEPPPHAIIILVCARLSRLAPTVLSRCRIIRFSPLPARDVADWLTSEKKVDRDRAAAVASLAEGSLARAEALADAWDEWSPDAEPWRRAMQIGELLEVLEDDRNDEALQRLRSREGARWTLTLWSAAVRAALRKKAGLDSRDAAPWLDDASLDRLARLDSDRLAAILDDIAENQIRLDRHANVHLVLTHLGFRLR